MYTATLLADPHSLHLERIISSAESLTLVVRTKQRAAACPRCGEPSRRIHSRYTRRAADLPWHGVAVRLELHARRFFCDRDPCPQRVFCERLPHVVAARGRRSMRLNDALALIGFAAGGEAGARLALELGMAVSPDTLLRRVRQAALPDAVTPRVLGVDDWAKRKGHSHGTILVDLERRRPIDLLPDRGADTLAAWLTAHPGIEIISRDRGTAYAEAIRRSAPEAVQVADRWHILKNLTEAVERFAARQHQAVRRAAVRVAETDAGAHPDAGRRASLSSHQYRTRDHAAARRARYTQVVELHRQGVSARHIAELVGVHRVTAHRFIAAADFPERAAHPLRPSKLDPFVAHLEQRWTQGVRNVQQLWREVRARGYAGGTGMVRRYVHHLRSPPMSSGEAGERARVMRAAARSPSSRRIAWWLQKPAERLADDERLFVEQLCVECPEAVAVRVRAAEFRDLLCRREVGRFEPWLAAVKDGGVKELINFADGLKQDRAAVEAAIRYKWSQGQVEGQINRLKLIKRSMFGRANLDLLKARVLHSA